MEHRLICQKTYYCRLKHYLIMKTLYKVLAFTWLILLSVTHVAYSQGEAYEHAFNGELQGWWTKNNTFPMTAQGGDWANYGPNEGFIGAPSDAPPGTSTVNFLMGFGNILASEIIPGYGAVAKPIFENRTYGYVSVGYTETDYDGASISKWLISPVLFNIKNGDIIKFKTRERLVDPGDRFLAGLAKDPNGVLDCNRPNRLEVRLSITGNGSNTIQPKVGNSPNSVGDFTYKLLDINPNLTPGGYPTGWTEYTIVISGLPAGQLFNGRIGFWYHYENGGYNNCRSRYELPLVAQGAFAGAGALVSQAEDYAKEMAQQGLRNAKTAGKFLSGAGKVLEAAPTLIETYQVLSTNNQRGTNGTFIAVDDFKYIPKPVLSLRESNTDKITYEGYGTNATKMGYRGGPDCPVNGMKSVATYRMWNQTNAPVTFYAGIESGYPLSGESPEWSKYELTPSGEYITLGAGQSMVFTVKLKPGLSITKNPNIPGLAYLMIKEYVQSGPEILSFPLHSTILPTLPPVARCTTSPVTLTLNDSGFVALTNAKSFDNGSTIECGDESLLSFSFSPYWNGTLTSGIKTFTCEDIGTHIWYLAVKHPTAQNTSTCPLSVTVKRPVESNDIICSRDTNFYLTAQQKAYPFNQNVLVKPKFKGACPSYVTISAIRKTGDATTNYLIYPSLPPGSYTAFWELARANNSPVERTCQSTFNVFDTIKPIAACAAYDTVRVGFNSVWIVGTKPPRSKLRDDISAFRDIGLGSYDNVGIQKYGIYSPWYSGAAMYFADSFEINCNNIGAIFPVTLKVTDYSGNTSTCQTVVKILDPATSTQCKDITITLDPTTGTKNITANELLLNGGAGACGLTNITLSKFSFNCSNKNQTIPVSVGYKGSDNVVRGCVSNVTVKEHTIDCADTVKYYLDNHSPYPFARTGLETFVKSACSAQVPWSLSVNGYNFPSISGTKAWDFNPGFTEVTRQTTIQNQTLTCKQVHAVYDNDPPVLESTHANDSFIYGGLQACTLPYEIINQFRQGTYEKWSYTLSGATQKYVEIDPSNYKYWDSYWLNQWDTLNPGITTITLSAVDRSLQRTTVSYTVKVVLGEVGPYVGLPKKPNVPIIDTLIQGDFCGATYNFYVQTPVQQDSGCKQTGYMWYYQVRDGYQGNILFEQDSIPQIAGADIPIKIGPKYNQNYLQYIYFGYHDKTYGNKSLPSYSLITVRDTVLRVMVPQDTTVQSFNDSTFTYHYTIPSPIKYPGSCAGGYWGYSVSGATTLKSVVNPAIVYNGNQIWELTNGADYSKAYPSVPADSSPKVKLNIGQNTIEYYVLEANGNGKSTAGLTTYKYNITVEDASIPVMTCPPNDTIHRSSGACLIATRDTVVQVNGFRDAYGKTSLRDFGNNSQIKLNKSTAPDSVTFTSVNGGILSSNDAFLLFVFNCSGTVSFNWEYKSNAPVFFRPFITFNNFNPNAATKPLPAGFNVNNTGIQTGTYTQTVAAGDVLRIGLNEGGGVSGYFKISNFSAPNANTISSLVQPTFADNAALYFSSDIEPEYPIGNYTINYSLTNLNNNKTTTCAQTLTVIDDFASALSCADDTLYLGPLGESALDINNVLSASCFPVSSTTLSKNIFTGTDIGTQQVRVTSITQDQDTLTCHFKVTVIDTIPPSGNSLQITLPLSNTNTATLSNAAIKNFFYDNHKVVSATASKTSFNCEDVGTQTISATAIDSSGNSATISVTVEITSGFAPITPLATQTITTCSKDTVTLTYETDPGYSLTYQWQVKEKVDSIKHWNFYTCAENTPFINGTYAHKIFSLDNETYAAYIVNSTVEFRKLDTISNNWRPALAPINEDIYTTSPNIFRLYVVPDRYNPDELFIAYINSGTQKFVIKGYQPYTNTWYTYQDLGGYNITFSDTTGAIDYFSYQKGFPPVAQYPTQNYFMSKMYGNDGSFFLTQQQPYPGGYDVFCVGLDTSGKYPFSYKHNTGDSVSGFGGYFPVKRYNIARGATLVDVVANGKNIMVARYSSDNFNRFFELIRTPSYYGYVIVTGKDSLTNDPTGGSSLFAIKNFNNKDYIAYKSANGKICVKQYNGTNSWGNVGALDFSDNEVTKLNLGIVNNQLYVVYVETSGRMVIKKLENNAWKSMGSPNDDINIGSVGNGELNIIDLNKSLAVYYTTLSGQTGRLIRLDEWKNISGATSKTYKPNVSAGSETEYRCIANSSCVFTPSQTKKVVVTKTPAINLLTKQANVVTSGTAQLALQIDTGDIKWQYGFTPGAASLGSGTSIAIPFVNVDTTVYAYANNGECYSDTLKAKIYSLDSSMIIYHPVFSDSVCYDDYIQIGLDTALYGYEYSVYSRVPGGTFEPDQNNSGYLKYSSTDEITFWVPADTTREYKILAAKNVAFNTLTFSESFGNEIPENVDFGNVSLPITQNLTVEAWVGFNEYFSYGYNPARVLGLRHGDMNAPNSAKNWEWVDGYFNVYNGNTKRSLAFPNLPPAWKLSVATTADASGLKIYYNGALVAWDSTAAEGNINNNSLPFVVAANSNGLKPAALYAIDDFRVWNTTLSASQILNYKDSCLMGNEPGLLIYNDFSNYNVPTKTLKSITGPDAIYHNQRTRDEYALTPGLRGCALPADEGHFTAPFKITVLKNQPTLSQSGFNDYYESEVCGGEVMHLVANPYGGTQVTWYNALRGGDVVGTSGVGTGYTLDVFIDKDTTLYAMATNSVCQRWEVEIDMTEYPEVYAAELEDRYCKGQVLNSSFYPDVDYDGSDYRFFDSPTGGNLVDIETYEDSTLMENDTLWVEAYNEEEGGSITCVSLQRVPLVFYVVDTAGIPKIIMTKDSSRYGSGEVTLEAHADKDGTIVWFDMNGNYLDNGDEFTTPYLTTTTQFIIKTWNDDYYCDSTSTDTLTATIIPVSIDTVIACESYMWKDSITYTSSISDILYLKHNNNGSDSAFFLNLTIVGFSEPNIEVGKYSMCTDDSTTITVQSTQSGYHYMLVDTSTNAVVGDAVLSNGNDIVFNTRALSNPVGYKVMVTDTAIVSDKTLGCTKQLGEIITIYAGALRSSVDVATCGSYTWKGNTYYESGTYYDTLSSSQSCDSIVALNLTILSVPVTIDSVVACGSYTWHGVTYYASTNIPIWNAGFTEYGCDSVVNLHLTIPTYTVNNPQTICNGKTYTFNGHSYTTAGTYRDTLQTATGCDSIIVTQLTVNPKPTTSAISGELNPTFNSTEAYSVTNTVNSTYKWVITNGVQVSGTNTHSISVQWGTVIGNTSVKVVETNMNECVGDTVTQFVSLPVKLISLTASKLNKDVELTWATASEQDNKGFEIHKSEEGSAQWEFVNFVKGNGTTNSVSNYAFVDENAFNKTSSSILYYRLKQVDFDGKYEYSPIVSVSNNVNDANAITVTPNPFHSEFKITINTPIVGYAKIEVSDALGRLVKSMQQSVKIGDSVISISDTDKWKMGVYFVTIHLHGQVKNMKVIKY